MAEQRELPDALAVLGASKRFGSTRALDSVDLRLTPGKVLALVGANGSGKSTLIKALAGYHLLDAGTVFVHGAELNLHHLGEEARQAGLRFVHQDLALIPNMSIADNLAMSRAYHRDRVGTIKWSAEMKRAREQLAAVGVEADPGRLVRDLGPVDRTLLAIARALDHVDPTRNILLLDEPTARLPQEESGRLIRQLKALRDRGLPVVYVSHRLEEIYDLADSLVVLRDGRQVYAGPLTTLPIAELHSLITGVVTRRRERGQNSEASLLRSAQPVLALRSVSARRLRGVSLVVHPGEVLGVTGLIGSGRSELGRVVYGLQPYAEGEVVIGGQPTAYPLSRAVTSGQVGYTPQERRSGIHARLTVQENLTITSFEGLSGPLGLSRRRVREAAQVLIDLLRVRPPDPGKVIDQLSGGNQQKVVLGKWLRLPLRLIILDEPTQSIDIGAKAELMTTIRERAHRQGLGVLWLESDVEELVKYADRVLVMRAGRIVAEFTERPFQVAELVAACYAPEESLAS